MSWTRTGDIYYPNNRNNEIRVQINNDLFINWKKEKILIKIILLLYLDHIQVTLK